MSKFPRLVLATRNPGKIQEFRLLLKGARYEIVSLMELPPCPLPREGDRSYEENALAKARAVSDAFDSIALADDSGLEVDALGGLPGVLSARYGGEGASAEEQCQALLNDLSGVPREQRTARFRAVVALVAPWGAHALSEGVLEGAITDAPAGETGFGYDPIFLLPELGLTLAQLGVETKNRLSHRARAIANARPTLDRWRSA
ncbi:MAG TPA: RdgB/HAM1 family non-canonical purine NTP pyrophosphatase [Methylomirabilota bacterium]|nr:RdgB/HAM1 family non-canonical purine NTP pyrophosphatase [Methylomirabilota bacterium]